MHLIILVIFGLSLFSSYIVRRKIRGNIVFRLIRITLMNLPYLTVFIFLPLPFMSLNINIMYFIVCLLIALLFILSDYKNLKNSNNSKMFRFVPKVKGEQLISRFCEVTLIPIIEEMFYRGTIPITQGVGKIIFYSILTTFLFNLAHYIGNDKSLIYHIKLFLFSLTSISIYLITENLLYCIVFHTFFNVPWFVTNVRLYLYFKKKEKGVKNAV